MASLLVGHPLLDRLAPQPSEHRLHGLHDEEEDGRRDRDELNESGDERAVAEDGVVDREREVAEVGLADDRRDERSTSELTTAAKATPMTKATASSMMLPRNRKSLNSFSISFSLIEVVP